MTTRDMIFLVVGLFGGAGLLMLFGQCALYIWGDDHYTKRYSDKDLSGPH
jgi:hypothetical protein